MPRACYSSTTTLWSSPDGGSFMQLLDSKVCVITGGAGSLGSASARLFLSEGAKVMLVDLNETDLARTARELGSPNVDTVAADVSDAAATKAYIEGTVARFGPID